MVGATLAAPATTSFTGQLELGGFGSALPGDNGKPRTSGDLKKRRGSINLISGVVDISENTGQRTAGTSGIESGGSGSGEEKEIATARQLIREARAVGVTFKPVDGALRMEGASKPAEALLVRIRAHKGMLTRLLTPLGDRLVELASKIFDATILKPDDDPPGLINRWLDWSETTLAKVDSKGRPAFTRSEIDCSIIGLRSFAADARVAAMLERLRTSRDKALTASTLSRRCEGRPTCVRTGSRGKWASSGRVKSENTRTSYES